MKPIYPYDPFQSVCPLQTFEGPRGERCLRLTPVWPELFERINHLGPLLAGVSSGAFTGICRHAALDFQPVPDSSEVVDTVSGWVIDTRQIAAVVAVREQLPCLLLGLQFFDSFGNGMGKLLLTEHSNLALFTALLGQFALGGPLDNPEPESPPDPVSFPVGSRETARCTLIKSLLLAHERRFGLRFSVVSAWQHRSFVVCPCRLERAGDDFYVADCRHELHLADVPNLAFRRIYDTSTGGSCLLAALGSGHWLELDYAGPPSLAPAWSSLHARGEVDAAD